MQKFQNSYDHRETLIVQTSLIELIFRIFLQKNWTQKALDVSLIVFCVEKSLDVLN
jgi:hypothetical protein